jgi:hypothetical protein
MLINWQQNYRWKCDRQNEDRDAKCRLFGIRKENPDRKACGVHRFARVLKFGVADADTAVVAAAHQNNA